MSTKLRVVILSRAKDLLLPRCKASSIERSSTTERSDAHHAEARTCKTKPVPTLRHHQRLTLTLLFLAGAINFLDRASLSVANTTIRSELHLSATQMGWLLTAFSFAYGLAQVPLISLLDSLGTRITLGAGLALWSTAQLLTGFVTTFPVFIAFRVLLGIGESPFYPAGIRSLREWFPAESRGRATAFVNTSQTIALAAAPPLLTAMMLSMGWRKTFIVLGASGLAISAAWLALHRSRHTTAHALDDLGPTQSGGWRKLITQRTAWGMMLGFGGVNYTNWLYTAWLPGYLQEGRHLSLAKTGWLAAIPFLCGAAGMFTSGLIADTLAKRGHKLTTIHRANIVAGMVISAAATFFVAHSSTTAEAIAGISLALFCIHFAGTSGWGYAQAVTPAPLIGSMTALQNFASFMIASAAPVLTGLLLDRTHSFTLALAICSFVTVLGALSYATLAAPSGMRLQSGWPPQ